MTVELETFSREYVERMAALLEELDLNDLNAVVDTIWKAYQQGKTIFLAGNGGSASTATHLAADIGKNTVISPEDDFEKRFKTVTLCDNSSWMTAVSNDLSYEDVFVEQLKNFAEPGDVLILISGSGNSPNLLKTALWANKVGLTSIGMLAFDGGQLKELLDVTVVVPTHDYGLAESAHSFVHHYIVEALKVLKEGETK